MTIRTYKPRRGRVSARQAAALETDDRLLVNIFEHLDLVPNPILNLDEMFGGRPVVLDIGFGTAAATIAAAVAEPGVGILAVEVHTAGLGDLLLGIRSANLSNVRVASGDALELVRSMIPAKSLAGVRSFFPDPWPKARHHKRRLVSETHVELLGSRTKMGGFWHLATDWRPYAEHMLDVFSASPRWQGGIIDRPTTRPVTRYESKALLEHRDICDLWFTRCSGADNRLK